MSEKKSIAASRKGSRNAPRPRWKRGLQYFMRFLMFVLFFVATFGPVVLVVYFWEEITTVGFTYAFFGRQVAVSTIALVACLVLIPLGAFGLVKFGQMIYRHLMRKPFHLSWKPKAAALALVGITLVTYFSYVPYWYLNLGIKPQWGPYLAFHGSDGVQVSWDTSSAKPTELYYGPAPDNVSTRATGGAFYWENDTSARTHHHCVALTGLVPGQRYYYRVPGLDNRVHAFTAPPAGTSGEPVRFTILGDTQGAENIQQQNIGHMVDQFGPDGINFTLIVGDLVNDDDDVNEWAMLFGSASYGRICAEVPWMGTSGNHECSCDDEGCDRRKNFKTYFQNDYASAWNENDTWDVGTYYSFDYSNVHVVILDVFENRTNLLTDRQVEWLEADLAANADKWKFLCFHLCVYSTSEHGSYPALAAQLEPIMYEHKVNALFYGHDHIYERYHINATAPDYPGTLAFLCAGGGGSLKPVLDPSEMGDRVWNGTTNAHGNAIHRVGPWDATAITSVHGAEWQVYAERTHHFMSVEVTGEVATFRAFRTSDGSLIEEVANVPRT